MTNFKNTKNLKPVTIIVSNILKYSSDELINCILDLFNVYNTNTNEFINDVENLENKELQQRLKSECLKYIENIPTNSPIIWYTSLESYKENKFLFNDDNIIINDLDSISDITRINFHYLFAEYDWMTKFTRNRTETKKMLPVIAKINLGHSKDIKICNDFNEVINLPIQYEIFEEVLNIENEFILNVFNDKELVLYKKDKEGNLEAFQYLPVFENEIEDDIVTDKKNNIDSNQKFINNIKKINDIIKNVITAKSYELNFCVTKDGKFKVIDINLIPSLKIPSVLAMFETIYNQFYNNIPEEFVNILNKYKKLKR